MFHTSFCAIYTSYFILIYLLFLLITKGKQHFYAAKTIYYIDPFFKQHFYVAKTIYDIDGFFKPGSRRGEFTQQSNIRVTARGIRRLVSSSAFYPIVFPCPCLFPRGYAVHRALS